MNDINGNEIKVGDVVIKACKSQLRKLLVTAVKLTIQFNYSTRESQAFPKVTLATFQLDDNQKIESFRYSSTMYADQTKNNLLRIGEGAF